MSNATTRHDSTPTPCPSWCQGDHLGEDIDDPLFEIDGTIHRRKVTAGDMTVTILETTDASEECPDPVGPVIMDMDWYWISEESIRNLAAALTAAADLIGVPKVSA